jgi:hypothetical protein
MQLDITTDYSRYKKEINTDEAHIQKFDECLHEKFKSTTKKLQGRGKL